METRDKTKSKKDEKSRGSLQIKILLCYEFVIRNRWIKRYCDFGVFFAGIILQLFNGGIINFLGNEICGYLKSQSLMLGMASSLGLTTVIVFGFNLGKDAQQFWKEINRKHGLDEKERLMTSGIQINYWQIILLILLYICIALDFCTLFYVLLTYDVICFVLLILKLWLIENVGKQYWDYSFHNDMRGKLAEMLEHCVDDNGSINIGIVRAYVEGLSVYLNSDRSAGKSGQLNGEDLSEQFEGENLYKKFKNFFYDTMEKLVLDRDTQSNLLLSIIRNFCKEVEKSNDFKNQMMLGIMITYALDWGNNINIEILYKEITNWNDKTLGLRYYIAVARMEYLYTVHKESNRILLSENLFCLYRSVTVEFSYRDIICVLWYLWCDEDNNPFILYTGNMWQIIRLFQEDIKVSHVSEAGTSLYRLIKGLKY